MCMYRCYVLEARVLLHELSALFIRAPFMSEFVPCPKRSYLKTITNSWMGLSRTSSVTLLLRGRI